MRRLVAFSPFAVAVLIAAGCAGSGSGSGSDDDDDDGTGNQPALTLTMEPWEVGPGEDRIWCKTVKVPGTETLDASRIRITMNEGSHHFILYRTDEDLPDGFGDCVEMNRNFITGSQTPGAFEVAFPDGKAMPIFGGEQLILESHYANASTAAVEAEVTVEFFTIPHEDVEDYLETVLVPYTDFEIPPSTNGYVDGMTVPEFSGFNTWQLSSHMHQRGVFFSIDRLVPGNDPERIYESDDWHSPVIKTFDPPVAGDSANNLRFECTWNNETGSPIHFGPTTDDEMCIMVVTFFPSYSYSP